MTRTATHCESIVPFDFAGTANDGTAYSWNTNSVAKGTHTITQLVTLPGGASEVDSASFSVGASVAPSITTQPGSQTVTAGNAASFNVTAAGTAQLSYQWKRNGTAISGATSSSYTTAATTSSDNGVQFTVVVSNSAGSVTSSAATLTVSATQISVTPASVSFGSVLTGNTNTQTIKLTNSSTANLTLSQAQVSGSGFSLSGLTFPVTLTPGQSTNFNVAFTPAGVGSVPGSVSLVSNASNSPLAIPLSGNGVAATFLLGTNPSSLGFGTVRVGGNSSLSTTLTNNGNSNVTISSVTMPGTGFNASGVTAGTTLTPNQSLTLNVAFTPTAAGSLVGTVTVVSNATNSPTTVALSGTGATATTVNVTTYGATGNGSTDDTTAINNAIAALQPGYQLFFPCGTYKISAGLTAITENNVAINGQTGCAAGRVTIRNSGGGSTILQVGASQSLSSPTPITATTADMDKTFQANFSAIGAGVGDYLYLEEAVSTSDTSHSNCGGSGCRGEVLKITSLNGNTATVETAVHHAYDLSCCVPWVQKLLNPVSGVSVHDLVLDGSGTANYALAVLNAVNLTVGNLTAQNVAWSAIASINGYNNSYASITITHAGTNNGGSIGGSAVSLQQQGNLNVNGVSISNMNVGAFGFIPFREANGTFSNISVDATGTGSGRPFKTNSSAHNTFNNISVNRSEAAYYQGITLEYFSHHNVWNTCKVTNNVGSPNNSGIALYGDVSNGNNQGSNHYNTFNNCTVTGNAGFAIWVSDNNNNIEINGGTYIGVAGQYVIAFDDSSPCCSNSAYIHNANIDGPGSIGIYIENGSKNACINNNSFGSGLSSGIYVTDASDIGTGNIMSGMSSNLNAGTCAPPSVPANGASLTP